MQIHSPFPFLALSVRDALGVCEPIQPTLVHLRATLQWLLKAQQVTNDGGVSAYYSLHSGWAPSFIETTGYIIDTFLDCSNLFPDLDLQSKAYKMGNFLLEMQLPCGGFRTYPPSQVEKSSPTIFNTGQDLLGLCRLYDHFNERQFLDAALRAGNYLINTQDSAGFWSSIDSDHLPHAYHSRVAMSLLKLAKISGYSSYVPAALKTLDAVLIFQHDNGWFDFSTLPGHGEREPITHTIAYTIEGLFYSGLLTADKRYVSSALKTLLYLVQAWNRDMGLFATYSSDWRPRSKYYCLTGIAQISALLFDAYNLTKRETFLECANGLCRQLKSWHQTSSGFSFSQGGVKGSYPIYGDVLNRKGYCRFAYINWAAKYFADSLFREHTYESS